MTASSSVIPAGTGMTVRAVPPGARAGVRHLRRFRAAKAAPLLDATFASVKMGATHRQGFARLIGWTTREVVLPTMPGSRASGAIIKVAGITGRIHGMKSKTPDGRSLRPSLVVLDDPQTDESARSLSQCATRESILAGAVLGLAGPGKKMSGIMPCTVIRPGDMADCILDRQKHPQWQGETSNTRLETIQFGWRRGVVEAL